MHRQGRKGTASYTLIEPYQPLVYIHHSSRHSGPVLGYNTVNMGLPWQNEGQSSLVIRDHPRYPQHLFWRFDRWILLVFCGGTVSFSSPQLSFNSPHRCIVLRPGFRSFSSFMEAAAEIRVGCKGIPERSGLYSQPIRM